MKTQKLSVLIGLLLAVVPLNAAVIFDTFGSTAPGYGAYGWAIGKFAQFDSQLEVAIPFTPGADYVLGTIMVAAHGRRPSPYDQVTVYLAEGATAPGPAIESFTFTLSGTAILTATSLSHVPLTAGTQYWVVLSAPDLANTSADWIVSDPAVPGRSATRNLDISPDWHTSDGTLPALTVTGTAIPEPANWLLLGSSLAGLLASRRRSDHRNAGRR